MEKLPLQSAVMSQLGFQHVIISHQTFRTQYLLHGLMQSADKENVKKKITSNSSGYENKSIILL